MGASQIHFQIFQVWLMCMLSYLVVYDWEFWVLFKICWETKCCFPAFGILKGFFDWSCILSIMSTVFDGVLVNLCSQLASNVLSGQIPERLFQILKYKYDISLSTVIHWCSAYASQDSWFNLCYWLLVAVLQETT